MTLTLPYPPTTNHAYTVARGRKVKTTVARRYGTDVHAACIEQLATLQARKWTRDTRLSVHVIVTPPDRRRRDLANTEKLALDAVFTWLDLDDSQVDDLRLTRAAPEKPGHLLVTIEVLS